MNKKKPPSPLFHTSSLALLTDLYQLTMAYGYWLQKIHQREAVFHLHFRRPPFQGGFTVAAGLEAVIAFIEQFHFEEQDLDYLSSLKGEEGQPLFPEKFLKELGKLRMTCHVDAVPEGTLVFPQEPLIRVQGPLIQCQLLESPLLNLVNFPTLVATKAARMRIAAQGDPVLEFGMRRAQGTDGALTASRAAYLGGCDSTSHLLAGKLFGIPVAGTHSHSWVMAFDNELESFESFARAFPSNCVFLVDTYNTVEGVRHAIQVGKKLKAMGKKLLGVRLDSGDLAHLSFKARSLLDEAGFPDVQIYASNELDETLIADLKRQGAQISVWGVGTKLVTAKDQPALDGVYKLSAIRNAKGEWQYKLKLSEQMIKTSSPGILQVKRFSLHGENVVDVIYDVHTDLSKGCHLVDPLDPTKEKQIPSTFSSEDLLVPIFRKGECIYKSPPLKEIRAFTLRNLEKFPVGIKRFLNPHIYPVGMEKSLYKKKVGLIRDIRKKIAGHSS